MSEHAIFTFRLFIVTFGDGRGEEALETTSSWKATNPWTLAKNATC